jgi:hypothetical protein
MKTITSSIGKKLIPSVLSFILIFILSGCGGGGDNSTTGGENNSQGQVLVGLTDGPGDFARYAVGVTAIKLHKLNGTVVNTVPTGTTTVDFTQLTNMTEFLTAGTVETGAYDQVVMTFDYSNADIEVYDENGTVVQIPVSNITDDDGNRITSTIDLAIKLDSNLVVKVGGPVLMALDFNLNSANTVTLGDPPSLMVSPVLSADITPDTSKIQRFRGALKSVDVSGNSFDIILRPFAHALSNNASFGTVTVKVDVNTVYNINGSNYSSADGLTALSNEPAYTAVVAHGAFDSSFNFTATEVLAGSSVPGGTLDAAVGTVLSRSGDTLTIKGATVTRSTGTVSFNAIVNVTLSENTRVSKQLSRDIMGVDDISVGQRIGVMGIYNAEGAVMDATSGYVRMHITSILGKLNYPAAGDDYTSNPGWLSLSIERINGVKVVRENDIITPFNFAGTGIDPDHDADINDYSVKPAAGLDTSSLTANNMPLRIKGFVSAFGSAPEDFDALTIANLSDATAFLNVGWGGLGRAASLVFAAVPDKTSGLTLNGTAMGMSGQLHRVNREGNITDFVDDFTDRNPVIQMAGMDTDKFIIERGETLTLYSTYAEFINALNTATTAGARVRHLYGWGKFNDSNITFTAHRLMIVLTII